MNCSNCGAKIESCDYCSTDFEEDDDIMCIDTGDAHVCEECFDDWLREHHVYDNARVEGDEE